jgi:hypothetical protein
MFSLPSFDIHQKKAKTLSVFSASFDIDQMTNTRIILSEGFKLRLKNQHLALLFSMSFGK